MATSIDRQSAVLQKAVDTRNERNRAEVAMQKKSQFEATSEAVEMDAALATMRWLQENETRIKDALEKRPVEHVTQAKHGKGV